MGQFDVTHNGKVFDLNDALDAVKNARWAMVALDQFNARKNNAVDVRNSPLTQALEDANNLLLQMKYWKPDVSSVDS